MTTNPIDDYVHQVASHLKLRGKARRQALAELLELLTEQATATSEAAAIAAAGPGPRRCRAGQCPECGCAAQPAAGARPGRLLA